MPQIKQFLLPDPAEGLTEAEIVSWKVAVGDTVVINQPIVDIETAKSLVELPCPYAGKVVEIHVAEGVTADVGTPIISIDVDPEGAPPAGTPTGGVPEQATKDERPDVGGPGEEMVPKPPDEGFVEPGLIGGAAPGGRTSVLVGYGPKSVEAKRRPRRGAAADRSSNAAAAVQEAFSAERQVATPVAPMRAAAPVTPVPAQPVPGASLPSVGTVDVAPAGNGHRVLAKPPVRKLARDLGVDLSSATPSGLNGTVTRDDVMALVNGAAAAPEVPDAAPAPAAVPSDRSPGEREVRTPIKGVRKMTAEAMVRSAFTAPHVTEWVTVDVTRTMELVGRLKGSRELEGVKVSPLAVVARALCLAVKRNPGINAAWDDAANEIVTKHYVNLGIAAATPRGLVVPNIKDADRLDLVGIATALKALTDTAREGRTPPADMQGGTISITNVGVFGVDGGTPILNPGEAAILCMGQVRPMPWVVDGELAVRQVMQLTLSFDHRLVDGDLGSRTLADVAAVLENPEMGLVWG
jgi:pyruvate dehydrogenase E2 component (dihydrolipoamide acetyltransferase)